MRLLHQSYVTREERDFVTSTIQAIGRCANQVPEVTDRCLHGLMSLITNKSGIIQLDLNLRRGGCRKCRGD